MIRRRLRDAQDIPTGIALGCTARVVGFRGLLRSVSRWRAAQLRRIIGIRTTNDVDRATRCEGGHLLIHLVRALLVACLAVAAEAQSADALIGDWRLVSNMQLDSTGVLRPQWTLALAV